MWNPFRKSLGKTMLDRRLQQLKVNARSVNDFGSEKLLQKWHARPTPFVNFTDQRHTKLVGRAREICLTNSYGQKALRILKNNVIGEFGMRLQSHVKLPDGTLDMEVNGAIEEAWLDFSQPYVLDTARQASLQEFQEICLSSIVTDGDFFVRIMENDEYEYGLKIQEIDALRVPPSSSSRYRLADTEQIYKNGIVFDKETMKPLWYSLNDDNITRYDVDVNRGKRIDAADMMHGFIKERTGQVRGVPLGHTSAATLYMIGKYEEAALRNAEIGASKLGFLTQSSDEPPPTRPKLDENGEEMKDEEGNTILEDALDGVSIDMEAGSLNSLPPGVGFADWSPEYPNQEFESFMRVMLRKASVGYDVAYADLSGDLTSVNYSSIRQGALENRENFKTLQKVIIFKFLYPLYKRWLGSAIAKGMIRVNGKPLGMERINDYCKPVWTPRRWPWIDPQSEAKANQIAIKSGLKAPSQVIKEAGGDPEETWQTIKQDIETMRAKGIPDEIIFGIFAEKAPTVEELIEGIKEGMGGPTNGN